MQTTLRGGPLDGAELKEHLADTVSGLRIGIRSEFGRTLAFYRRSAGGWDYCNPRIDEIPSNNHPMTAVIHKQEYPADGKGDKWLVIYLEQQ